MKQLLISLIGILTSAQCIAQDSIPTIREYIPIATIGATATTLGAISRGTSDSWHPYFTEKDESFGIVDAVQYTPLLFPWIMKAVGEPTRSDWGQMTTSHAISGVIMIGSVSLLKDNIDAIRPDGSDHRSFPSGHSAWAFMGASIVARELGWRSPWYTFGAYSVATGVAMQRVMSRRHLPADVVAGAGIGILSTQIGYFVSDLIFGNNSYKNTTTEFGSSFSNEPSFSLETGVYFPFGTIDVGGTSIHRGMAIDAGIKSNIPLDEYWSIGTEFALRSMPIWSDNKIERTYISTLNSIGIIISPSYRIPLSRYFAFSTDAAVGYYHKIGFKLDDKSITVGSGSAVGRINIGAEFRLDEQLSILGGLGYEISHYKFSVNHPNPLLGTSFTDEASSASSGLLLNLSTRVAF